MAAARSKPIADPAVHEQVSAGLARIGQRYTRGRRELVDALAAAGKPLTLPDLLKLLPDTPQSSAYRNLAVLTQTGAVEKLPSNDEFGRFELSEELTGHHHHHVQCNECGLVIDVQLNPTLEKAFQRAEVELSESTGFRITTHLVAFEGMCADCAAKADKRAR
jgi:Fur family transcriptional regulator, ferric uptake regulator